MTRPMFEAVFFGGRPGEDGRHDLIPFDLNDRWQWVVPESIETREYPTNRLTGHYRLRRADSPLPIYDWTEA